MAAPIDISDKTTNSFNPGNIASRALGGNINFGVSGAQIERVLYVASAVAGIVALVLMLHDRKKR